MILIVIGKDCVGKTYFREYVEQHQHIITYEASDYINEAKKQYNIDSTRRILDIFGKDYAAKRICELIEQKAQLKDNIVISGFRTLSEIDFMIDKVGKENVKIVEVITNNLFCYIRNITRNRKDRQISFTKFNKRQKEDAELGIYEIRKNYRITRIENNSTRKKFENLIDKYILQLFNQNTIKTNEFRKRIKVKTNDMMDDIEKNSKNSIKDTSKDIDIEI